MEAFFYANNTSQIFDGATNKGHQLIGEIQLPPGKYVVSATALVGTNVASGYPPPAWPHGGGVVSLTLGDSDDSAYATIRPESGGNSESIALMVASEITSSRRARLFFINPWPLRSVVNYVRITALQVDKLTVVQVGEETIDLPEEKMFHARVAIETGLFSRHGGVAKDDK